MKKAARAQATAGHAPHATGLVVASYGRHCLVETPDGQRIICHPRGKKSDCVVGPLSVAANTEGVGRGRFAGVPAGDGGLLAIGQGAVEEIENGIALAQRAIVVCATLQFQALAVELCQFRAAAIQARISGAKLEILPGVGHFSAIEAPEEFAERALAFLDSIDTRGAANQKD